MLVAAELHSERLAHLRGRARHAHQALGDALLHHLQAVRPRERGDRLEVGWGATKRRDRLLGAQVAARPGGEAAQLVCGRSGGGLRVALDIDRDRQLLLRINRPNRLGGGAAAAT